MGVDCVSEGGPNKFVKFARTPLMTGAAGLFLFGVIYYFAYFYARSLGRSFPSPLWFPCSILVCALLVSRPRHWWMVIFLTFPIRMYSAVWAARPEWFFVLTCVIDSVHALLVATALRYFLKNRFRIMTVKSFGVFCVIAVLLASVVSATTGAAARRALGDDFWVIWVQWFMGSVSTHLLVTPVLLYWLFGLRHDLKMPSPQRCVEGAVMAAGLVATTWIEFNMNSSGTVLVDASFYGPVLFLFWAAIRFGMLGASGAMAIVTVFSVDAAIRGRGPFAALSPTATALVLQSFLLMRSVPLYIVALVIRERTVVEDSLRESEERFRMMADDAPVLIWMSGTDKLCEFFNRGWLDFTGRTMEQELGNGWAEGVHPEDLKGCVQTYEAYFDLRKPFDIEYRLRRHDGEYRWVLDRGVPRYAADGKFLGYVGSVIDLTDRKRAEQARQDLIHASRLAVMGECTAMIAHELTQPLSAILTNVSCAQILLDRPKAPLKEILPAVMDIREDALRASAAIERIRAWGSKREMSMQPLDLNAAVAEVVRLIKGEASRRRVVVRQDYCVPAPTVMGDAVQLQQVVLNLILNAMDAMKDNPESERRLVVCTGWDGNEIIEVAIKDTGEGVTAENLPRVFDSFFTTKPEGMGIGLSMARSIIQLHSGRMWAENNNEGKGTTFRFVLPVIVPSHTSYRKPVLPATAGDADTEHEVTA